MYRHHWHLNYPFFFLILGLLLLAWAVTYSIVRTPMDLGNLWSTAPSAVEAPRSAMVQVAPGFNVPGDYYVQEKTYRAVPAIAQAELAPGFNVPLDYYIQEKMYHAPVIAQVELAPGFNVPLDYYIQEKTYRAEPNPAQIELAPGFSVPLGYFIQEKMYREPAALQ